MFQCHTVVRLECDVSVCHTVVRLECDVSVSQCG